MEITQRELVTLLHGALFGGFFVMAIFGALAILVGKGSPDVVPAEPRWQKIYLTVTVATGWVAVLTGAYIVYPWYRAIAPAGADLALYPKLLLTSSPRTAGWHNFGMEWKEHVAWIAPMAITMVAAVVLKHRAVWNADRQVRRAVLGFAAVALLAATIAGGWGMLINKAAPVHGGATIQLMRSAQ